MTARRGTASTLDAHVRSLVEETLAALGTSAWPWIVWRSWARNQEHARRLAEREGVRTTKIGRDLYGHREDLDALAARNAVVVGEAGDPEIDGDVAAAFGSH